MVTDEGSGPPEPWRRRKPAAVLLLGLGLVVCSSNVSAQLARRGGQFQIPSSGFEIDMPDRIELGPGPSIARLRNGDFVVIWSECTFDELTFERDCNFIGQRFTFTGAVGCPGDCNDDGNVTVDELVLAVRGALVPDVDPIRRCLAADTNLDYRIGLPELVPAVARGIDGCDAAPSVSLAKGLAA